MKKISAILFFSLHIAFLSSVFSQQKNLPLNREFSLNREYCRSLVFSYADTAITESETKNVHKQTTIITYFDADNSSCFKPYILSVSPESKDTSRSWFFRKLRKENFIQVNDSNDKLQLTIDPLFNFEYGKDLKDDSSTYFYKNTRGLLVKGDIGSKFSFESSFHENQATFVDYIGQFNNMYLVVPGQGRWKKFKNNGYDFAMASGYASYSPSKHFNFQIGHGKHFVGEGYRSLLLSDNTFNYPYARITSTFGKFQYINLYASFMNLTAVGVSTPPGTEKLFQKKAANFQFLSWNIHRQVQFGFFQGLIWQANDSMNRQHLNLSYASPIIYTATLTEGLGGNNNVVLGATLKLKITNSFSMYGQYMIDDFGMGYFDHVKNGVQIGMKYFNAFNIKNLHLQAEVNGVSSYAYSAKKPSQSYSHYNQALAHPLGSNFSEGTAFLNYRFRDFFTQIKLNYASTGFDHGGMNYGNNIFLSDTSNVTFDITWGDRKLIIMDFHIGYLVNPSTNLNIIAGISNRSSISPIENSQTNFVYFGIRTSLSNVYFDF